MNWLVKQLSDQQLFRKDLPSAATPDDIQAAYLADVRQVMTRAAGADTLLDEYYVHQGIADTEVPRAKFSLPWAAGSKPDAEFDSSDIHLAFPSALTTHESHAEPDTISLYANGTRSVKLRRRFAPFCSYLTAHAPVALSDVMATFSGSYSPEVIRALLLELIQHQLVVLRPPAGVPA